MATGVGLSGINNSGMNSKSDSMGQSWGQWAKEQLASGRPDKALGAINLGRGIDLLERNQRRAERIADTVLPDSAKGQESSGGEDDDEMLRMGDDIQNILMPPPQKDNNLKWLIPLLAGGAIAATGIGIPAAGIVGYMVSQAMNQTSASDPADTEYEDTLLNIDLKRWDDVKDYSRR